MKGKRSTYTINITLSVKVFIAGICTNILLFRSNWQDFLKINLNTSL